jgi:hypothetical protein
MHDYEPVKSLVYTTHDQRFRVFKGNVPDLIHAVSPGVNLGVCDFHERYGFHPVSIWLFDESIEVPFCVESQLTSATFVPRNQPCGTVTSPTVAGIYRGDPGLPWHLRFMELHVNPIEKSVVAIEKRNQRVELPGAIVSWDYQEGKLALAYKSGRVELRQQEDNFTMPVYWGYLRSAADYVRIAKRDGETCLATVKAAEPTVWFFRPKSTR